MAARTDARGGPAVSAHSFAAAFVDAGRMSWLDADHKAVAEIMFGVKASEIPFVLQSVVLLAGRMASGLEPDAWRDLMLEWSALEDTREVPDGR
jgi:hypothetical protein